MELIKGQFYEFSINGDYHIFIYDGKELNNFYTGFIVDIFKSGVVNYMYGGATTIKIIYKHLDMNLIEFHSYLKTFNNIPNQVFVLFTIWYNRLN